MSASYVLKDLPSYNSENFSLFNTDHGIRVSSKRPSVYIPTKEFASDQIIVSDKTSMLIRYLHIQWDKKNLRKRESEPHSDETARKRLRLTENSASAGSANTD